MADPVTLVAAGSLALGAVSAGIGAVGAVSSARAQSENAAYQAQVAQNNQTIANQNAQYAIQAGEVKAQDQSLQNRAREGAVVTGLAASGLDVNTGTPLSVQETQKETDALSTQRVIDASQLQAYGYRTQASNYGAESGLQTAEAGQATTAGDLGAAGGLIGGASSVGLNYANLVQKGVPLPGSGSSPTVSTNYGGVPTFPNTSDDF